jgi:hypothetical protein
VELADLLDVIDDWIKGFAKGVGLLIGIRLELYQALTLDFYVK